MYSNEAVPVVDVVNGGGNSGFGGGWDSWVVIILFALIFGWGRNGIGGGSGGSDGINVIPVSGGFGNSGFDTRYAIASELSTNNIENGITNGFSGIHSDLCSGFSGVNSNIANLGYQMQNCCCETREAISGVKYDLAMQHSDLLHNMDSNTRAIIESNNAGFRSILDKMCQDKIDSLNLEVSSLRNQLSQTAQNALLTNAMSQQTATLLQQLNPAPIPAYVVQNPNCCGNVGYTYNTGCGCGV